LGPHSSSQYDRPPSAFCPYRRRTPPSRIMLILHERYEHISSRVLRFQICERLTWGGTNPQASRSTTSRLGGWGAHAGRRYREPSGCAILVSGNAPNKFQSVFPRGDLPSPLRSKLTTSRSSTDPRLYASIPAARYQTIRYRLYNSITLR